MPRRLEDMNFLYFATLTMASHALIVPSTQSLNTLIYTLAVTSYVEIG